MKLHLEKIHTLVVQQWGSEAEITFMLKQYVGIKFEISVRDGKAYSYGWNACKKIDDGIECELTPRQKASCAKYIEKNHEALFEYFKNECPETKMPLLVAGA
ncbi:hypothetical protein R3O67_29280 [Bacillus cereus]|uniref:hypothetical protein n=1 Tax=Bacillus cereus TaxID=1396 RepID=UPI00307A6E7F